MTPIPAQAIADLLAGDALRNRLKSLTVEAQELFDFNDTASNSHKLYVFGDNLLKRGNAGQAVIRGAGNAYGIPTKRIPATTVPAYFSDKTDERKAVLHSIAYILIALQRHPQYTHIVFPKDGLGRGMARLRNKSPHIAQMLTALLLDLFGFDNSTGRIYPNEQGEMDSLRAAFNRYQPAKV